VNKRIFTIVVLFAVMVSAQGRQRLTGVITDSMCATGDHSAMQMAPTDAECTKACIDSHDADYVLYDGKEAYKLDDQKTPEKFAGKKVVITGTIDTAKKTIRVEAITLASGDQSK
jgi:hypothetical protein